MLRLVFYSGVRVSELCRMDVADVDLEACKIRIGGLGLGYDRIRWSYDPNGVPAVKESHSFSSISIASTVG